MGNVGVFLGGLLKKAGDIYRDEARPEELLGQFHFHLLSSLILLRYYILQTAYTIESFKRNAPLHTFSAYWLLRTLFQLKTAHAERSASVPFTSYFLLHQKIPLLSIAKQPHIVYGT
jgi:hypothetical protein